MDTKAITMEKGKRTTTITIDTLEFLHLYQTIKNVQTNVNDMCKEDSSKMNFNYFLLNKAIENFESELTKKLTEGGTDYAAAQYEIREKAYKMTVG